MAKLKIMGDIVQITTDLTRKEIERVKAYAPNALKLIDTDGNEIFGVEIGDAFYSKYGICFSSESAEGKMFMTTNNPVLDHSDVEKEREEVVRIFAPIVSKLQAVEAGVTAAKEGLDAVEAEVRESVVFVD